MHFYMHPYLHKKFYSCKKWVLQTVCHRPLGGAIGIPNVLIESLVGLNGRRLKILPARKPFPHPESLGRPFVPRPWDGPGAKQRPRPNVVGNSPLAARRQWRGCSSDIGTPHQPHWWRVRATCPEARPPRSHFY
jgi:hypothetical protein